MNTFNSKEIKEIAETFQCLVENKSCIFYHRVNSLNQEGAISISEKVIKSSYVLGYNCFYNLTPEVYITNEKRKIEKRLPLSFVEVIILLLQSESFHRNNYELMINPNYFRRFITQIEVFRGVKFSSEVFEMLCKIEALILSKFKNLMK